MAKAARTRARLTLHPMVWSIVCSGLALAYLCRFSAVRADSSGNTDVLKLQLEVDALTTLNDMHLAPAQLSALQDLASDTPAQLPTAAYNVTLAHATALQDLKAALISGNDDKISDAEDKVSDMEEQEGDDDEPDIEPTDAAKGKVGQVIHLLTTRELAGYIAENSEDVPDPGQILVDALNHCYNMSQDDYQSLKEDTTDELGELAGGANPTKTPSIIAKAGHFLDGVRKLSNDDFNAQLPTLRDQAQKLGDSIDPMSAIRHWMEGEMADLLSNPQLGQALQDRGVATKPAPTDQDQ
jgi:hypothetical protein